MTDCTFCGKKLDMGKGKMYVKKDGKLLYFCANKCQKNMIKLGRKPRNIKWTKEHRESKKTKKNKGGKV